tara:strand:+ start:372 stop:872 length:501 start_codon:yes stop_codon:yes gene_type:complete
MKLIKPLIFFVFTGSIIPAYVKSEYLRQDDLKSLVVSCYLENEIPVFCSKKQIDDPDLKIYLPVFKSIMIEDKIHAFRIMATIENLSKKNLIGAKIKLKSDSSENDILEFIISEKVKYKMISNSNYSHLVRSDVPKIRNTYNTLHSAYYNADISNFDMVVTEIYFE